MTLVTVTVAGHGIVFGSDSLVQSMMGPFHAPKVWCIGHSFGIAAYGNGPDGVPQAIDAFVPSSTSPQGVATELLKLFPNQDKMWLYVAGYENVDPQVLLVDVHSQQIQRVNVPSPLGLFWGGLPPAKFDAFDSVNLQTADLNEIRARTECLIMQGALEHPSSVGGPVQFVTIQPP